VWRVEKDPDMIWKDGDMGSTLVILMANILPVHTVLRRWACATSGKFCLSTLPAQSFPLAQFAMRCTTVCRSSCSLLRSAVAWDVAEIYFGL
jgi:hypothetical protein